MNFDFIGKRALVTGAGKGIFDFHFILDVS